MKIPKIIRKDNHKYIFVKEYPNFILYEDMTSHNKECFLLHDLGLIKENTKPTQEGRLRGITGMRV